MSALIGLCDGNVVHILTDAASTRLDDGVLAGVHRKQVLLNNGVVIAGAGRWLPAWRFAELANERGNFDEVADAAQELWTEAIAPLSAKDMESPGGVVIAGLSNGSPDMLVIEMPGAKFSDTATAFAIGPHTNAREITGRFLRRYTDDPEGFDVRGEGIKVMDTLRRHCPRHYEEAIRPAIGGFIQHTTVSRGGIESSVIHHWPDTVGRVIDPDATTDLEKRDDNYWGATTAQVFAMREWLVQERGLPLPMFTW